MPHDDLITVPPRAPIRPEYWNQFKTALENTPTLDDLQSPVAFQGVLDSTGDLPSVGNTTGDAYLVNGTVWVWDGTAWTNQGSLTTGPQGEAAALRLKGTKATVGDLPASGNVVNDVWIVDADSHGYGWTTDHEWVDLGEMRGPQGEPGDLSQAVADTLYAGVSAFVRVEGRHELSLYDDFSDHANGSIDGVTPAIGPVWDTGGTAPTVTSGKLSGSGGYAVATFATPVHYIEATQTFSGTGNANTLAWATTPFDVLNLIHMTYSVSGFDVTYRSAGTWGPLGSLMFGTWRTTCAADSTTRYKVGIAVMGDTVAVFGPNGEVFSCVATVLRTLAATNTIYYQPTADVGLTAVRAVRFPLADDPALLVTPLDIAAVGMMYGPQNQIAGNFQNWWEVSIGQNPNGLPGITFGPQIITTKLTSSAGSGTSTITTERAIYGATSVTVGYGATAEGVTLSGAPTPLPTATGPYAQGISGTLASAHSAGEIVIASGFTRPTIAYNPFGGTVDINNHINLTSSQNYRVNGNQVLRSRITGWGAASGTKSRATFATGSVTTAELAQRVAQLIDDLIDHGMIGS